MSYSHPMPVVAFTTAILGDKLFVITAGGEGVIRVWQYNASANTFAIVLTLEGHIRGITSLLLIGRWYCNFFDMFSKHILQEEIFGQHLWTEVLGAGL
jgi:hypothetical protein